MPRVLTGDEQLRNLFASLTEHTFHVEFGVADPPLVDYLSDMLVRFIRIDSIFRLRDVLGRRLEEVADMILEAEQCEARPRQMIHRHIGDFTLFWTGVYPEMVDHLRRGGKDALIDYQEQGKRAYWIASTIPVEPQAAPADVLKRLSEQFELCVYGLGEVRRQWEHTAEPEAPLLLG
jgi:hypothetical protein